MKPNTAGSEPSGSKVAEISDTVKMADRPTEGNASTPNSQ